MKNTVIGKIEQNPVIAAIRDASDIEEALQSQVTTIFLLHADIFNIGELVRKIRESGKSSMIHIDFLEGIGRDQRAIDYISEVIRPDGIITTKSSHIRYAREKGLFTIQRFFLVDSLSFDTTIRTVQVTQPDMIEVLPGIIPKVIRQITSQLSLPVIAGGLIETKEDIMEILKSGALGVSMGKKELWVL